MFDFNIAHALRILSISLVPALLGIILHEVAHGWMAEKLGDPTARMMGRLTLNPIPHIDPMGLAVWTDKPHRLLCLWLGKARAGQSALFSQD